MVDDTMAIAHEHRQPPWPERTPSSTEKTAMKTATPSRTCTPRLRHQRRRNGRVAGLRGVLSGSTLLCCQRRPPAPPLAFGDAAPAPLASPTSSGPPVSAEGPGSEEEPATSMMSCGRGAQLGVPEAASAGETVPTRRANQGGEARDRRLIRNPRSYFPCLLPLAARTTCKVTYPTSRAEPFPSAALPPLRADDVHARVERLAHVLGRTDHVHHLVGVRLGLGLGLGLP